MHELDVRRFYDGLGGFIRKCGQWWSGYETSSPTLICWLPSYGLVTVLLVWLLCCRQQKASSTFHRCDAMLAVFVLDHMEVYWQVCLLGLPSVCRICHWMEVHPAVIRQKVADLSFDVFTCCMHLFAAAFKRPNWADTQLRNVGVSPR